MELLSLLSQADRQLGKLDMYSEYIPNIDLFISMHVVKEATQSSKIEGTRTNIEDAILDKSDVNTEIKETHRTLLQGVRGKHKQPGTFRKSQNWIGGLNINDAVFIPPVHTSIHEYMSDLENFAHNSKAFFPDLLKIALIHYYFETIHPFLDGNGRIGRLMITLYLVEKGILKKPILYLSDFFEKNRTLYYDNLTRVREKNELGSWFKFFLQGIIETTQNGINTFDSILKLQQEIEVKIQTLGSRINNAQLIMKNYINAQL